MKGRGEVVVAVRTDQELELMRKSGKITALVLKKVIASVKPGVSLLELEDIADRKIRVLGAEASFRAVSDYRWATCLTVNNEVVHGIPRDIKLKEGDILGIDLGAVLEGWHTDVSWSVLVGSKQSLRSVDLGKFEIGNWKEKKRFLEIGERALWKAVNQAREGKRLGDISAAIQDEVEGAGCSVVESYVGHGIGRSPHEAPEIHGIGRKGTGLKLKKGMTLAIEVIYTAGSGDVLVSNDGWTVISEDGSLGGLFEMTVIVGKKKPEVITDWRQV